MSETADSRLFRWILPVVNLRLIFVHSADMIGVILKAREAAFGGAAAMPKMGLRFWQTRAYSTGLFRFRDPFAAKRRMLTPPADLQFTQALPRESLAGRQSIALFRFGPRRAPIESGARIFRGISVSSRCGSRKKCQILLQFPLGLGAGLALRQRVQFVAS
ncbi:hypothetical protein Pr1d_21990 [Bythopirellula goksoeyrii]|uniref:Uncharacterized protein n=1 Tax=Bythopirellula goksoeyrii TaxID=1400387 RepID=A0A5B9QLA1_9BACT|nr:hypothetical protein Pr1d_21990 [Bythopirellula goksoeyrii]